MSIERDLIERYGPQVLAPTRQNNVPPRVAAPGKLIVATPRPAQRKKLVNEIRSCRFRAYAPKEAGRYTFSTALPAFSKHALNVVGEVARRQIGNLYPRRQRRAKDEPNPYKAGQAVYRGEVPATVVSTSGRMCVVRTMMLGKEITQALHYSQLRPG
jgi:hypothetical protein